MSEMTKDELLVVIDYVFDDDNLRSDYYSGGDGRWIKLSDAHRAIRTIIQQAAIKEAKDE